MAAVSRSDGSYRKLAEDVGDEARRFDVKGLVSTLSNFFGGDVHDLNIPKTHASRQRKKIINDIRQLEDVLSRSKPVDENLRAFQEGLKLVSTQYKCRRDKLDVLFHRHIAQLQKAAIVSANMVKSVQAGQVASRAVFLEDLHTKLDTLGSEDAESLESIFSKQEMNHKEVKEFFIGQLRAVCTVFAPQEASRVRFTELQRVYYASIRLRSMYFLICSSLLTVALCAGFLMQFFFQFFDGSGSYRLLWLPFLLFPVFMVAFALLGDELSNLVNGSLGDPCLPRCRAVILTAAHYALGIRVHEEKTELKKWLCFALDLWFTTAMDLFMLVPMMACLLTGGVGSRFAAAAVTGGIAWACFTTALFIVSDVYIGTKSWFLKDKSTGIGIVQEVANVLADIFHDDDIVPGRVREHYYAVIFSQQAAEELKRSEEEKANEMRGDDYKEAMRSQGEVGPWIRKACFLWFPFVVLTYFLPPYSVWSFPITGLVLAVTNRFLSMALRRSLPSLVGDAYTYFHVAIVGLTVVMFLSGAAVAHSSGTSATELADPFMVVPRASELALLSTARRLDAGQDDLPKSYINEKTSRYPVCTMSWGSEDRTLQVLDLAALSGYAYMMDQSTVNELLTSSFAGAKGLGKEPPEVVLWTQYESIPRIVAVRFRGAEDTIVVGVKGTSTAQDAFTDSSLYAMISVLQAFDNLAPVLSLVPNFLTAWLLKALRLPYTSQSAERIFTDVMRDIDGLKHNFSSAKFVLTGHSLGGGIAEIVGTRMSIPTLVFSAPGMTFSRARFRANREKTNRNVVGIQPESDVVPQVDVHHDMVQKIACRDKDGQPRPFVMCHFIKVTLCEIWRACGDPRGRDFSSTCAPYVSKESLGRFFHDI